MKQLALLLVLLLHCSHANRISRMKSLSEFFGVNQPTQKESKEDAKSQCKPLPQRIPKMYGFIGKSITGINTPIRVNNQGHVECYSDGGRECRWNVDETFVKSYGKTAKTVSCEGKKQPEDFGGAKEESDRNWCEKAKKFLSLDLYKWYSPKETKLDTCLRRNHEGEIECPTIDGKDCIWNIKEDQDCLRFNDSKVLTCGECYRKTKGISGYETPDQWCYKANRIIPDGQCCDASIDQHNFRCDIPGISIPVRRNANGNMECLSLNGKDCLYIKAENCAEFQRENRQKIKPLECGQNHWRFYGVTGYEDGDHWCARSNVIVPYYFEWMCGYKPKPGDYKLSSSEDLSKSTEKAQEEKKPSGDSNNAALTNKFSSLAPDVQALVKEMITKIIKEQVSAVQEKQKEEDASKQKTQGKDSNQSTEKKPEESKLDGKSNTKEATNDNKPNAKENPSQGEKKDPQNETQKPTNEKAASSEDKAKSQSQIEMNCMNEGVKFIDGLSIRSPNSKFVLRFNEKGSLEILDLVDNIPKTVIFSTNTPQGKYAVLESTGQLSVKSQSNESIWSTHLKKKEADEKIKSKLCLADDASLTILIEDKILSVVSPKLSDCLEEDVILKEGQILRSVNKKFTARIENGNFLLKKEPDGKNEEEVLFSSETNKNKTTTATYKLLLKTTGQLFLFRKTQLEDENTPIWNTEKKKPEARSSEKSRLCVGDKGDLYIYMISTAERLWVKPDQPKTEKKSLRHISMYASENYLLDNDLY